MRANREPKLEPRQLRDESGWFVLVTWGDWPSEQIGGFPSQAEAQQWIDRSSANWIEERIADSL